MQIKLAYRFSSNDFSRNIREEFLWTYAYDAIRPLVLIWYCDLSKYAYDECPKGIDNYAYSKRIWLKKLSIPTGVHLPRVVLFVSLISYYQI